MSEIDRLRGIMDRLRGPDGCPWDRQQTLETLGTYLLEETYEVLEAITGGSAEALREELGDLLFQIVFQCRIAQERGAFDLESVMREIGDKIVRRHPHVFGDTSLSTAGEVLAQWEQIKVAERRNKGNGSMFGSVPRNLPALLKALRLSSKAARVGFDWPDREGLLLKLREETEEMRAALEGGERAAIEEEVGDLLFVLANLARRADIDPEEALQAANRKFVARFAYVERRLKEEGLEPAPENRDRMERLWEEAKQTLRKTSPGRTSPSSGTSGSAARRAPRGAGI
jgi:tetrapyrrole methylase family protein/MazG family protein